MKIFLAQQNYHIGNIKGNTQKIIDAIRLAKKEQSDLVVFSELCICGYPPKDFLYFDEFLEKCEESIKTIMDETEDIAIIIGAPQKNNTGSGKKLFNSAYFIQNKSIQQIIQKTCLPSYDIFDEDRYFEPAKEWNVISFKGKKIALTICEDIWSIQNDRMYQISPMEKLSKSQPDLMINISASPFDYNHDADRLSITKANALKYKIPLFYCNTIGGQTDIVFDGNSLVLDINGNLIGRLNSFEEDYDSYILNEDGTIENSKDKKNIIVTEKNYKRESLEPSYNIESVYQAIIVGIRDYFSKMGFSKAIVGNSGGIDSAVTIALATKALGKENVLSVLMPSAFSSEHSVSDAVELCKKLQTLYHIVPIENIYDTFLTNLEPVFDNKPFNIAEENIQSRIRGNILMGIANKFGYILLNTSNKSELATGYGTLYGDMAGGLSVLGDCYKLQVYELAKYINQNAEIIPANIISKEPSAELRPNQKDSDSLPDYKVMDNILFHYIDKMKGPEEIIKMGYEKELVETVLKMVNTNEYKRNQFCPIIRISSKSFGSGRRMPIVGKYFS